MKMEYILGRLITYGVRYEKITSEALRIFGNFKGFSSLRLSNQDGFVEIDGILRDKDFFEEWLYLITL